MADGTVSEEEYLEKLNGFVARNTNNVKNGDVSTVLQKMYQRDSRFYKTRPGTSRGAGRGKKAKQKE